VRPIDGREETFRRDIERQFENYVERWEYREEIVSELLEKYASVNPSRPRWHLSRYISNGCFLTSYYPHLIDYLLSQLSEIGEVRDVERRIGYSYLRIDMLLHRPLRLFEYSANRTLINESMGAVLIGDIGASIAECGRSNREIALDVSLSLATKEPHMEPHQRRVVEKAIRKLKGALKEGVSGSLEGVTHPVVKRLLANQQLARDV
jgi:hypothetical protein